MRAFLLLLSLLLVNIGSIVCLECFDTCTGRCFGPCEGLCVRLRNATNNDPVIAYRAVTCGDEEENACIYEEVFGKTLAPERFLVTQPKGCLFDYKRDVGTTGFLQRGEDIKIFSCKGEFCNKPPLETCTPDNFGGELCHRKRQQAREVVFKNLVREEEILLETDREEHCVKGDFTEFNVNSPCFGFQANDLPSSCTGPINYDEVEEPSPGIGPITGAPLIVNSPLCADFSSSQVFVIVGAVVGGLVILVLLAVFLVFKRTRDLVEKNKKKDEQAGSRNDFSTSHNIVVLQAEVPEPENVSSVVEESMTEHDVKMLDDSNEEQTFNQPSL